MRNTKRFIALFSIIVAVIQIYGIGEKLQHALWQWYKFKDFSGDGYTTVSMHMFLVTTVVSVINICVANWVSRQNIGRFFSTCSLYSSQALLSGIMVLIVLLASPLAQFR
jgi:magnesium-transporting ATPase (P-type)